jgi:hypothetical protein
MSKITKATFKSFVKKNRANLLVWNKSSFDGMVDCVMPTEEKGFAPAVAADYVRENNLGICGVWLVGGSRDYFTAFEKDGFVGIDVYNCVGHFIIAIKK